MAKTKITGQSKLLTSPLPQRITQEMPSVSGASEPTRRRKITKLKNYKLNEVDLERIRKLVETVNEASHRKISETRIIQGLLLIGSRMSPEKLLKAINES